MIIKLNNSILRYGGNWLSHTYIDPYNPLKLPPNTLRIKYKSGYTPRAGYTQTLVDADENIWDIYIASNYWGGPLTPDASNILQVLGANSSNVTNMSYMFNNCNNLTSVALFDTRNVTGMNGMFAHCTSLTTVPLYDTSNISSMECMFYECTSLTSVPLFNTSNVTNMNETFWGCTSLTSVPLFDTRNVTNMESTFWGCTSLTTVPLFNTSSVTSIINMFKGCTSLTTVPLFNTSNVTDMNYMFYGCINVQSGALALYNQASTQTNPPTYHSTTFWNCGSNTVSGAAELAQIPNDWKEQ